MLRPVTATEVKQIVFAMNDNKSPGPDGYGSGFFKGAWSIIGEDFTSAILEFFDTGMLLKQLNSTRICVIPNTKAPESAGDYSLLLVATPYTKLFPNFFVKD